MHSLRREKQFEGARTTRMFKTKYFQIYSVFLKKEVFTKIFPLFLIGLVCSLKKVFVYRFARIFSNLPGYVPDLPLPPPPVSYAYGSVESLYYFSYIRNYILTRSNELILSPKELNDNFLYQIY